MPLTFVLPPSLGTAKAAARAELIESALFRDLGERAKVVVAATYGEVSELATSGRAQLLWAPTMVCTRLPSARAIFTIARNGTTSYRSVLVMRKGPSSSLNRLAGLRAAWVDPLSAGGYLLAVALLRARGIDADTTFSTQTFTGSHRATIEAVLHGTADIGAVSARQPDEESISAMLRWYAGPAADQLTALAVSEGCLNDALVIANCVGESEGARLIEKLVPSAPGAMARSRLLAALEAERLVPATLDDYHRLSALFSGEMSPRTRTSSPPARAERPRSR
ncbi:MAG: PhnD/SsuA/transferrin family substrate-binding protein [Minicystis sp.]